MTTNPPTDQTGAADDAHLRVLLATADPVPSPPATVPGELRERVMAAIAADGHAPQSGEATTVGSTPHVITHPGFLSRHWQGLLWAAASIVSIALAATALVPGLLGTSGGDASLASRGAESAVEAPAMAGADAGAAAGAAAPGAAESLTQDAAPTDAGQTATAPDTAPKLARSATVLVGTDDIDGARNRFVAEIGAMGGRVMAESVITGVDGSGGGAVEPYATTNSSVTSDLAYPATGTYPYPWYPSGPGVWLNVQVPVDKYDEAVAAARATGEVVRLEQSTTDVTSQVADTNARIAALEASLARLTSLLGQATSVSDVVALEEAMASRQAELDSLRAQQSALASQTSMSAISLTLMSPEDATAAVSPTPTPGTWWESFLAGLTDAWAWLGTALLIVSPLLIAGAIVLIVRRRRRNHRPTEA